MSKSGIPLGESGQAGFQYQEPADAAGSINPYAKANIINKRNMRLHIAIPPP